MNNFKKKICESYNWRSFAEYSGQSVNELNFEQA